MTYEEAREEVLKVAGDYKEIRSLHCIRTAMLGKETEQIKDDILKAITSLSISPETLQLSVNSSDQMCLQVPECTSHRCESVFDKIMRANKAEDIIKYFEHCIKSLLYLMCCGSTIGLKDVQRACSYGTLVMNNLTDDLVNSLLDKGSQLRVASHNTDLENNTYQGYCERVEVAMARAAHYWSATSMIFKPGMKMSVRDLRTSNTSETTKVRTVKRVTYSNGELVFYFTDTASVLRGTSRIHELETYVLNTPEMFEIAETLKLKRLESIL